MIDSSVVLYMAVLIIAVFFCWQIRIFAYICTTCRITSVHVHSIHTARYAAMPYADLKAQEVQRKVREGLRLPKQKTTPDELHQLCLSCWNHVRTERLSFAEIARMLVKMTAKDMETNHNTVRDISAELARPSTSGGERRQSVSQRN